MLQHVNTVLIGTEAPASYTNVDALTNGQIALFNEDKKLITDTAGAEAAAELYVGLCEGKETIYDMEGTGTEKSVIRFSMPIKKGSKPNMVFSAYKAKAEDVIVINASGVTVEVGHRYVLRLVYHDIYEAPGQFTHTYEVVAKTTNVNDVVESFAKKINKDPKKRVVATVSGAQLTLTAMEKPYRTGTETDTLYSQVSMDAFMWTTIPSGLLSNVMYPISNLTISKTQGTPGKGNAKIVRDREDAALGYRGITHRANGIYPYIAPEFRSDLSAEYDTLSIEWDNLYLSNDNQYIKTTPLACELYVNEGQLSGSTFLTALQAFVAKA